MADKKPGGDGKHVGSYDAWKDYDAAKRVAKGKAPSPQGRHAHFCAGTGEGRC